MMILSRYPKYKLPDVMEKIRQILNQCRRAFRRLRPETRDIILSATTFMLSIIIPVLLGLDRTFVVSVMIILLVHEYGHWMAMRFYKHENVSVRFYFLLAITRSETEFRSRLSKFVISIAGPLPGIIIGSLIVICPFNLPEGIEYFGNLMILVNAINLVPVAPFDGGNIFESIFFSGEARKLAYYNFLSGGILSFYGILDKDYFILLLSVPVFLRGIIYVQSRDESGLSGAGFVFPLQKLIMGGIWFLSIIISLLFITGCNQL